MEGRELTIGILSLQGAFIEHEKALERLSRDSGGIISSRQVKQAHHLQGLDGLIIPGGESTVMKRLVTVDTAAGSNLLKALIQWTLVDKMPTMGTCAGAILLSKRVDNEEGVLGGIDCSIVRNYYGSQLDSFIAPISSPVIPDVGRFSGVFIRAPLIKLSEAASATDSKDVKVLATIKHPRSKEDHIVAVEQGNLLALTFHPELTDNTVWHEYFIRKLILKQ